MQKKIKIPKDNKKETNHVKNNSTSLNIKNSTPTFQVLETKRNIDFRNQYMCNYMQLFVVFFATILILPYF
jgi:hypothetical protein